MNLTRDDVDEIVKLLDASFYDELRVKTDRFDLHLRRSGDGWTQERATLGEPRVLGAPTAAPRAEAAKAEDADVVGLTSVRAPMVGTFYRAPKPGAPPFVEVGAAVEEHQAVGIIETMKLMNSIPAGASGVVAEILVADGTLVEAGQTLMRLKR
jgi:acetyl-CoA carboxylase biotin carboxyl carrier protein